MFTGVNTAAATAAAYLTTVREQMVAPPTFTDLVLLEVGCREYLPHLHDYPDLDAACRSTLAALRAACGDFAMLYLDYPQLAWVIDSSAARGTVSLRCATVPQLREVVTICAALGARDTTPSVVLHHLALMQAAAQDALFQQLGQPEVFVAIRWEPTPGAGSTTLVLALHDLWFFFWLAQRLSESEIRLLYSFGQQPAPRSDEAPQPAPREAFPAWLKASLLLRLKQPGTITHEVDSVLALTYALIAVAAISYSDAATLAAEVTGKPVKANSWMTRIARWTDARHLPRPSHQGRVPLQRRNPWPVVTLAMLNTWWAARTPLA